MSDNLTTEVVEDQADAPAEQAPVPKKNRRQLLEREGEVAADFLEKLLDIADRCPVHRTLRSEVSIHTAAARADRDRG